MLGRPLLFLSSYAPLFALLAIRFEQRWLWISCTVLAVLGVVSLWLLLRLDARSSPGPHTLVSSRDAGVEAAGYLATYLLPFLTVATPTIRDVIAYAGFLAWPPSSTSGPPWRKSTRCCTCSATGSCRSPMTTGCTPT